MRIAMLDVMVDPTRPGASGLSDVVWHMARELTLGGDPVAIVGTYSSQATTPPCEAQVYRLDPPTRAARRVEGLGLAVAQASARAALTLRRIPALDLVFAPDFVSGGIAAVLAPRLPVVCTTQGNIYERIATKTNPFGWVQTQVYKLATRFAVRHCAHIVATSGWMRDWWLRSGSPPDRISVIQRGTDVGFFRREAAARQRLGIEEEIELVLFAGRFSTEKNVALLLRAIAALAPSRPTLRLHLCGTGPGEQDLRSLARTLRIESLVTFAGWADHQRLRDYYSAADLLALPSTSEPLGRVILEAMACETLVLATSVGGPSEVITHEKNGLLLSPRDAEAWQTAIARALDDRAWRMALTACGRETVVSKFSWAAIVRRLRVEVFARVLARTARRLPGGRASSGDVS